MQRAVPGDKEQENCLSEDTETQRQPGHRKQGFRGSFSEDVNFVVILKDKSDYPGTGRV